MLFFAASITIYLVLVLVIMIVTVLMVMLVIGKCGADDYHGGKLRVVLLMGYGHAKG